MTHLAEVTGLAATFATMWGLFWPGFNRPLIAVGSIALVFAILALLNDPPRAKAALAAAALALTASLGLGASDRPEAPERPRPVETPRPPSVAVVDAHLSNLRWLSKRSLTGIIEAQRPACSANRKLTVEVGGRPSPIETQSDAAGKWRLPKIGSSGDIRARASAKTEQLISGKEIKCAAIRPTRIARAKLPKLAYEGGQVVENPSPEGPPTTAYVAPTSGSANPPAPSNESSSTSDPPDDTTSGAKSNGDDWGEPETVEPANHE